MMKLNFWQWLGLLLVVIALIWYVVNHASSGAPTTQP
jgi:hypothetical protein